MSSPDVFNSDLFSLRTLTLAIKKLVYTPTRITELGLFDTRGIDTTSVFIDIGQNSVNLVSASERGSTPASVVGDKYESRPFKTLHLSQRSNVLAEEVQNVRLFGSDSDTAGVEMKINELLGKHVRNLALTKENHMLGAIKGEILDADGITVLLNLHTEMGTSATAHDFAFTTATTKIQNEVLAVKRLVDEKLGGVPFTGIHVLCGKDWFDSFTGHPKVEESWLRFSGSSNLRDDLRRGFTYGGVTFEEYRGGAGVTIADDEAWAIPMGVSDLFIARYAPADYMETVNTIGVDYYAKSEPMEMNKGVVIETQTNPLFLCTRPDAIINLTSS